MQLHWVPSLISDSIVRPGRLSAIPAMVLLVRKTPYVPEATIGNIRKYVVLHFVF
jgi:hypothetical protein